MSYFFNHNSRTEESSCLNLISFSCILLKKYDTSLSGSAESKIEAAGTGNPPKASGTGEVLAGAVDAKWKQMLDGTSNLDIRNHSEVAGQSTGISLLAMMIYRGSSEDVKDLVRRGASLTYNNETGTTPVMTAARYGKNNLVEFFLQKGVGLNKTNTSGRTAFHYAAMAPDDNPKVGVRNAQVISTLCEKDRNRDVINIQDGSSKTALDYAREDGYEDGFDILVENGATGVPPPAGRP